MIRHGNIMAALLGKIGVLTREMLPSGAAGCATNGHREGLTFGSHQDQTWLTFILLVQ